MTELITKIGENALIGFGVAVVAYTIICIWVPEKSGEAGPIILAMLGFLFGRRKSEGEKNV